jgi:hypothetical protein
MLASLVDVDIQRSMKTISGTSLFNQRSGVISMSTTLGSKAVPFGNADTKKKKKMKKRKGAAKKKTRTIDNHNYDSMI